MTASQTMAMNPEWEFVSDQVMGGVSTGQVTVSDDQVARLTGRVSLENNGGFIQMAFDLRPDGQGMDVSEWRGIRLRVTGNSQPYEIRLRTADLQRPWQSYALALDVTRDWRSALLPFAHFMPHRTEIPFNAKCLRRIGVLAVGREGEADISVSDLVLYR